MEKKDRGTINTRDVEFKINISTEDIDNIIQEIKNIEKDSKHFKEFSVTEDE